MSGLPDILEKILATKRAEVEALRERTDPASIMLQARRALPPRGFLARLKKDADRTRHVALIAEVKKASPSKGIIRHDFDPRQIAHAYHRGGASCLSVLTDTAYFQGALGYLTAIREDLSLPLLRKDFLIDPLQVAESRAAGADAVLLIAACLDPDRLHDLHREATALGMDVLVEVHNRAEWDAVLAAGPPPPLVGINNRNLRDFSVRLETTAELAPAILEAGSFLIAESGIHTPDDVALLREAGARGILVGESLMRQPDPGDAARVLLAKA